MRVYCDLTQERCCIGILPTPDRAAALRVYDIRTFQQLMEEKP